MTPAKAIRLECKWCMGSVKSFRCDSEICKLNDKSLSPLKRIRAHCLDCTETRQEVKNCTGKLLFEYRLCFLHSYRMGTNPKRKGIGNKKPSLAGLEIYKKSRTHDMVSASKTVLEALA